jgi:hypothetical protein
MKLCELYGRPLTEDQFCDQYESYFVNQTDQYEITIVEP